jgi:adenylylsulfate kinase-like enzyme
MQFKNSPIIWLTGMSGSGKSTLSIDLEKLFLSKKYKVRVLDGDDLRDKDREKLGFGYDDVMINNIRISELCIKLRREYDAIIVPVISPYEPIRQIVKDMLSPNFYLVYLKADIDSLRARDTKGLYEAADKSIITDLIGYSEINPYNEPANPDITIETGNHTSLYESKKQLISFINKKMFIDK